MQKECLILQNTLSKLFRMVKKQIYVFRNSELRLRVKKKLGNLPNHPLELWSLSLMILTAEQTKESYLLWVVQKQSIRIAK